MNITPNARIILEKTFIQGYLKRARAYIRRKRIAQTVANHASRVTKKISRKPPGVRSQTQYIQPDTTANVGLYHIRCTQRVRPVTGDNRDAQDRILKRVRTAPRITSCGIRKREKLRTTLSRKSTSASKCRGDPSEQFYLCHDFCDKVCACHEHFSAFSGAAAM